MEKQDKIKFKREDGESVEKIVKEIEGDIVYFTDETSMSITVLNELKD